MPSAQSPRRDDVQVKPVANGSKRTIEVCCWPDCFAEVEHPDVPLCEAHFREAGMAWLRDNIELVRDVAGVASQEIMFDRERRASEFRRPERDAILREEQARREAGAIVYYLRIGDRIKIGFTTNLSQRLNGLRLDASAVLVTEPGGRDVEARRHREFADERYGRREDFAPSDRLLAHIERLKIRA